MAPVQGLRFQVHVAKPTVLHARGRTVSCRAKAATISQARKLLAIRGWNRAWIDGVTERIVRKQITASEDDLAAVV